MSGAIPLTDWVQSSTRKHVLDDDKRRYECRNDHNRGDHHQILCPAKLMIRAWRWSSRTAWSIRSTALPALVRNETGAPSASILLHVRSTASATDHDITLARLTSRIRFGDVRANASRAPMR
jgi:hypothetical protein